MDTDLPRETLGDAGVVGVALLVVGVVLLGRENRRAAVAALAVVIGYSLLVYGLVGSFLDAMGMEYEDLH